MYLQQGTNMDELDGKSALDLSIYYLPVKIRITSKNIIILRAYFCDKSIKKNQDGATHLHL